MSGTGRPGSARKAYICLIVAATAILALTARHLVSGAAAPPAGGLFPSLVNERVMIISPHPDDESLACAGVIQRAVREAEAVKVVWVNDGDANPTAARLFSLGRKPDAAAYRRLGDLRHREVVQAAADLGLTKTSLVFLCYPDGATNSLWRRDRVRIHRGANGRTTVQNNGHAWHPGAPYTGLSLERDLTSVVKDFRPTVVIYPDPTDVHHDHWATALFTGEILHGLSYSGASFTYITHHGYGWPWPPWFDPGGSIIVPENDTGSRRPLTLNLPGADEARKLRALSRFQSQGGLLAPSINSFVRVNEVFYAKL